MWYIIIVLVVSIGITIGVAGCKINNGKKKPIGNQNDSIMSAYTKAEIEKKLKKLSESPAPKNLSMGAMCYEMAALPDRAEYICPVCGEKTIYTDQYRSFVYSELQECRSYVEAIRGINAKLDESQFCKKCSPDVTDPELCLITQLEGENTPYKCCGIYSTDLQVISEFLNGKDVHSLFNEREEPLKDYVSRIEELLGVKIE
jgi:hypothetical protein